MMHALDIALVVVNALACAVGAWQWWRTGSARAFWSVVRAGQGVALVVAGIAAVRLATGREEADLTFMYRVLPLAIAFVAEQLRLAVATTVLDARNLQDADEVRTLPEAEQLRIVEAIVDRETAVMATAAGVMAVLGLRAAGWL